jgi:hypothetical protein
MSFPRMVGNGRNGLCGAQLACSYRRSMAWSLESFLCQTICGFRARTAHPSILLPRVSELRVSALTRQEYVKAPVRFLGSYCVSRQALAEVTPKFVVGPRPSGKTLVVAPFVATAAYITPKHSFSGLQVPLYTSIGPVCTRSHPCTMACKSSVRGVGSQQKKGAKSKTLARKFLLGPYHLMSINTAL